MTKAALTKLLILVILAFIICLPEFFSLYRVSKVNFLCRRYRPCERGNQVKKGENGKIGDAEIQRKDMCDPSQTAEREKWEQECTQGNQINMADPASDSRRGSNDSEKNWFMCQTDMDMAGLKSNILSSATALKVHLEVSVELHLGNEDTLNLTLYGHSNYSSLDLHPPEEQEEEEDKKKGDEGQKAFYCCLPVLPTSESANQSRCLLWLANQTVSTAAAKEKLPWKRTQKDEWRCVFRVVWMALLCVVLLTIVTTVLGQIYFGKRSCKKPMVQPVYNFTVQQLNDGEKHTELITPKGTVFNFYRSGPWSELSPIEEADSQEDTETLLDETVDHCYTGKLTTRTIIKSERGYLECVLLFPLRSTVGGKKLSSAGRSTQIFFLKRLK
ncbi:uncharacterized protein LOC120799908 isoform X2 [Xiphias gladius]|uniref:uncharacterized protein LOC120799908 isoform X2 n=1 Tax=Xiphias gladius TaxID=8245 RepID=UPI001A99C44E|nr:uncharacterized protein LOC120799908 isoform X2 [Xiphias gladius]